MVAGPFFVTCATRGCDAILECASAAEQARLRKWRCSVCSDPAEVSRQRKARVAAVRKRVIERAVAAATPNPSMQDRPIRLGPQYTVVRCDALTISTLIDAYAQGREDGWQAGYRKAADDFAQGAER